MRRWRSDGRPGSFSIRVAVFHKRCCLRAGGSDPYTGSHGGRPSWTVPSKPGVANDDTIATLFLGGTVGDSRCSNAHFGTAADGFSAMVRRDLVRGQMLVCNKGGPDFTFMVFSLCRSPLRRNRARLEPIARTPAFELWGRNRLLRQWVPRNRRCDFYATPACCADAARPTRNLAKDAPAIVEALLASLARRSPRRTARLRYSRVAEGANRGAIDGGSSRYQAL